MYEQKIRNSIELEICSLGSKQRLTRGESLFYEPLVYMYYADYGCSCPGHFRCIL